MRLFLDTSAFVKRYIEEAGSASVQRLCDSADEVFVSMLLPIEAISTFRRLLRENRLSKSEYAAMRTVLLEEIKDITVVPISSEVVADAIRILEAVPLKSIDAIHVASAAQCPIDRFVSADVQQLTAAQHVGLKTISP